MAIKVKKELDLATATIVELKTHLAKLKRVEANLEIALTLRKYPDIEQDLIRITAMVVELSNVETLINFELLTVPEEEIVKKKEETKQHIIMLEGRMINLIGTSPETIKLRNMYCVRIIELKNSLEVAGLNKKVLKYKEMYLKLLVNLLHTFNNFKLPIPTPEGFSLFAEIPLLQKYIEKATLMKEQQDKK